MKETKIERTARFFDSMSKLGFSYSEATALRRIELTLQRWSEAECNGEIERDEVTEKPFRRYGNYIQANDPRSIHFIADREAGALKRLSKIMANHPELWSYHQGDPRGCALYVGRKSDVNGHEIGSVYSRGVAVCI